MSDQAPFFDAIADAPAGASLFWCKAKDGTRIRAGLWRGGARGTVLLYPGRTEYIEKYGPTIAKLTTRGFTVLCIDWRGQGLSDRPARKNLGDVVAFNRYQHDIEAALASPFAADLPGPRILIGHSMGGAIGLRSLRERNDIAAAIFSGPMWGIAMAGFTRTVATIAIRTAYLLGFEEHFAPGLGAKPYVLDAQIESNTLTSDPDQLSRMKAQLAAHPELGLGGPSLRWLHEAMIEMSALSEPPLPDIPILTFLGTEEAIVDQPTIKRLAPAFPQGELVMCEGARHEIFMEAEQIQSDVWSRIDSFLAPIAPAEA